MSKQAYAPTKERLTESMCMVDAGGFTYREAHTFLVGEHGMLADLTARADYRIWRAEWLWVTVVGCGSEGDASAIAEGVFRKVYGVDGVAFSPTGDGPNANQIDALCLPHSEEEMGFYVIRTKCAHGDGPEPGRDDDGSNCSWRWGDLDEVEGDKRSFRQIPSRVFIHGLANPLVGLGASEGEYIPDTSEADIMFD